MVEICIYRDENGSICKYIVSGHANYVRMPGPARAVLKLFSGKDKNAGFDTVCASVSSITQNAIVGLKGVLGLNPGLEVEDGYLECIIPGGLDSKMLEKTGVLLETMYLSLKNIEEQYCDYVKVKEMEV